MSTPEAGSFAKRWIAAWNDHDVERVLVDYADSVVFTSPTAARVVPESAGVIRGKAALRDYWVRALAVNTDLRFELLGAYAGVNAVVLNYRQQTGVLVNEVLVFENGLVAVGYATHLHS